MEWLWSWSPYNVRVKVIGADPTLPYSFWPTFNFGELMQVDYDFVPEATHFLQLEKPKVCSDLLRVFIEPIVGM